MAVVITLVAGGLAVMMLVVWAGTSMLRNPTSGSSGGMAGGGLGDFVDVFDPAQGRAARDLASQKETMALAPTPDDDDPDRVRVDLHNGVVRIPRRPVAP